MNKYKLIIADYGETMVHTGEKIKIENVEAIKKYQEEGGYFSITTGREWPSIRRKITNSKLSDLDEMMIICCYGSLIISSKTNKIIYEAPLSENLVIDSINYLSENDIPFSLVSKDNTLIVHNVDVSSYRWKQYNNKNLFENCEELIEYVKDSEINIYKIDVYSLEKIELFSKFLDNSYPDKCKAYISDKRFAEFVSIDAGKNNAYVALKNYYKFENNQIIVVGDALNDLGLFEHAINRVAVSNAIKDILETSTYIVENEDYCGISRLIYKILKDDEI